MVVVRRNAFYLLIGCIAIALVSIFWYADETRSPLILMTAFVAAVAIIYYARTKVTDFIEDERDVKITEQATMRTMQVFWVVFCAISLGAVMQMLQVPSFPREPREFHPPVMFSPKMMGFAQLGLLCLMIFLYVGFRIYYARKYGEWDNDEE
jgi:uncharacterized membrane protein